MRALIVASIAAALSVVALGQTGTLHANRATEQPSLTVERSWNRATVISDFRQREPFEGRPATEKTEVAILYGRGFIFVRVHCFDSQPKRVVATELRRDVDLGVDDN